MLETILKISLVLFMVGNLLDLGLRLDLKVALRGFRDFRFMGLTTLWGFILCPGLGYLLAHLIPAGAARCHGSYPDNLGARRADASPHGGQGARGRELHRDLHAVYDLGHGDFLPVMVPVLVKGLTVTTWMVAKPMLFFILLPMVIGVVIKLRWASFALRSNRSSTRPPRLIRWPC